MGRGGYDTTDPSAYKSSAAAEALRMHAAQREREDAKAAEYMAAEEVAKLIRGKKSRGIKAARNAEKMAKMADAGGGTTGEAETRSTTMSTTMTAKAGGGGGAGS